MHPKLPAHSAASLLWLAAAAALAGPIDPPPGPVADTKSTLNYKTLAEVEPRTPIGPATTPGDADSYTRITSPGSYYLTANLQVPQGLKGIEINAEHVTIDLNGFQIVGSAGGSLTLIAGGGSHITIRNGTLIRGDSAIDLVNSAGLRVQDLSISNPAAYGVRAGDRCTAERVHISNPGSMGIRFVDNARIDQCDVTGGATFGGISAGGGSVITRCTVRGVAADGITAASGSTVSDCTASECGDDGFSLSQATVTRCASTSNTTDGFKTFSRSTITNCTANFNGFAGFRPQGTGTLRNNTACFNAVGIRSESGTGLLIADNECSDNTSYGLWMNGATGCRIDGNHFYSNGGNGVYLNANGAHLFIRNTARGNAGANFTLDASSDYGQILTNPGAGFSATNPWANFSY